MVAEEAHEQFSVTATHMSPKVMTWSFAFSQDGKHALSGSDDKMVRLWEVETGRCLQVFEGHTKTVTSVAWSPDEKYALSGSSDKTMRQWDVETGKCLRILKGSTTEIMIVAWCSDQKHALSGSNDRTVRSWEVETKRCLRAFRGHNDAVWSVAWSPDQKHALSGSDDKTVRLWEVETGRCLRILEGHTNTVWNVVWSPDQKHALSGDSGGDIRVWNLSAFCAGVRTPDVDTSMLSSAPRQIQYTNAKVLLVGETSAGKTGLAHRLATQEWKPSDGSTIGTWATQWKLLDLATSQDLGQEIWLWDFGGQADQRLIHQLYMDRTDLILLLFNADKEDVLSGLRDWQMALRRSVPANTPLLLVAGRTDTGFKASRAKLQGFADENGFGYYETSAKEGQGCEELSQAIMKTIAWDKLEKRTSPLIFKRIKDEVLKLRDEGQVLLAFKELRETLRQRLHPESEFTDAVLETVIGLLNGPGAVKELDYGTYILLQPEWINAYAQAVIRTLRQDPTELGCLPLRSIAEGKLLFQTVGREGGIEHRGDQCLFRAWCDHARTSYLRQLYPCSPGRL